MTRAMRRLYFTSAEQRMLFGKTSASESSRFIREISDENIDIHGYFNGFNYDDALPGSHTGSRSQNFEFKSQYSGFNKTASGRKKSPPAPALSSHSDLHERLPDYENGDVVNHSVFGRGVITNAQPAGNDVLLEIDFDEIGSKRMLLKSTARFITKNEK